MTAKAQLNQIIKKLTAQDLAKLRDYAEQLLSTSREAAPNKSFAKSSGIQSVKSGRTSRTGKNQHVVPIEAGGWAVKGEGNERVTKVFTNKEEAAKFGREIAKNQRSELIIHGKDAAILSRNSYPSDLTPPIEQRKTDNSAQEKKPKPERWYLAQQFKGDAPYPDTPINKYDVYEQ